MRMTSVKNAAISAPVADVRHHQIQIGRPPGGARLVLGGHQRRRGQCHQLPGEQEGDHVVGDEHELDGAQQDVEGDAEKHGPLIQAGHAARSRC